MAFNWTWQRWTTVMAAGVVIALPGHGRFLEALPPAYAVAVFSALATQDLVAKMTLSEHADQLNQLTLVGDEVWKTDGKPADSDYETDQVSFYRSVYVEAMQSEKGRSLGAAARAKQLRATQKLQQRIDLAWSGGAVAGQLVNLDGEIWSLSQIADHFTWTASDAGIVAGRAAVDLHFEPRPNLKSHTRIEHVLGATAGNLMVDRITGQILSGDFRSLGEVRFGGGLLAHLTFHGEFRLQPAGDCWVIRNVRVDVQGRVLFSRLHGTQINTYSLAVADNASRH